MNKPKMRKLWFLKFEYKINLYKSKFQLFAAYLLQINNSFVMFLNISAQLNILMLIRGSNYFWKQY